MQPLLETLRNRILDSLASQGFCFRDGHILAPDLADKTQVRKLHQKAVQHAIEQAKPRLARHENRLLSYIADGREVDPQAIQPRLIQVHPDSEEELLFRYCKLHWSVPISSGYGRRLRFLVIDEANGKLIGLFGLGDPVMNLNPRERWIGWTTSEKHRRISSVMELFVLGAVPPYSQLLCGKLVALLTASLEVRKAFERKYANHKSYIRQEMHNGRLALLTTTSALGRSSIYNRLSFQGQRVFISVGYTKGYGEFHFNNGLYHDLSILAKEYCIPTAKNRMWGKGFRNRRELVRKTLPLLNLPLELMQHGIHREVFVVPLAHNAQAYLREEHTRLRSYTWTIQDLFQWFRQRWLLPRAASNQAYCTFKRTQYRLWKNSSG